MWLLLLHSKQLTNIPAIASCQWSSVWRQAVNWLCTINSCKQLLTINFLLMLDSNFSWNMLCDGVQHFEFNIDFLLALMTSWNVKLIQLEMCIRCVMLCRWALSTPLSSHVEGCNTVHMFNNKMKGKKFPPATKSTPGGAGRWCVGVAWCMVYWQGALW